MSVMWLIHVCDMTHSYVRHDSFKCIFSSCSGHTRLMLMCDVTHWWVGHDSSTCVLWPIHMCDTAQSFSWRHSFICVTWLSHMSDMTHSCVWHDSFMRVPWLIRVFDLTYSYVYFRDIFGPIRMTKVYMRINRIPLTQMSHVHSFARCDLTHLHVRRDAFIRVTWHIHVCCMPHSYVWCDAFMCAT